MEFELAKELATTNDVTESEIVKNAVAVLRDEKSMNACNISLSGWHFWMWRGFRMMQMEGTRQGSILALIGKTQWVAIVVKETGVAMYYVDDVDDCLRGRALARRNAGLDGSMARHSYGNQFVFNGSHLLVYLVLFLWDLHQNGFDKQKVLLNYLLYRHPNKPFTTHHVFSRTAEHGGRFPTMYRTLRECCRTYEDVLDEVGDFHMSTALQGYNAWDVRTPHESHHHQISLSNAATQFKKLREVMHEISLPELISRLSRFRNRFVNEGYFLFEDALAYNRVDIATWCWFHYNLDTSILGDVVKNHKYNDVVCFVYSLTK